MRKSEGKMTPSIKEARDKWPQNFNQTLFLQMDTFEKLARFSNNRKFRHCECKQTNSAFKIQSLT